MEESYRLDKIYKQISNIKFDFQKDPFLKIKFSSKGKQLADNYYKDHKLPQFVENNKKEPDQLFYTYQKDLYAARLLKQQYQPKEPATILKLQKKS